MKMLDIRKIPTSELTTETTKLREEIAELRRRVHMGEQTNVRLIRNKRKDLSFINYFFEVVFLANLPPFLGAGWSLCNLTQSS